MTLSAIGTMAAVHDVTVSGELPGTVDRMASVWVEAVREGDVLAELDTTKSAHSSLRSKRSVSWRISTTSG